MHLLRHWTYDTELMAYSGDPILLSTSSSHFNGPFKCISNQHGHDVMSCRWYWPCQPLTKLTRTVHMRVSAYDASKPDCTTWLSILANSFVSKIFMWWSRSILRTTFALDFSRWFAIKLCTKIGASDRQRMYSSLLSKNMWTPFPMCRRVCSIWKRFMFVWFDSISCEVNGWTYRAVAIDVAQLAQAKPIGCVARWMRVPVDDQFIWICVASEHFTDATVEFVVCDVGPIIRFDIVHLLHIGLLLHVAGIFLPNRRRLCWACHWTWVCGLLIAHRWARHGWHWTILTGWTLWIETIYGTKAVVGIVGIHIVIGILHLVDIGCHLLCCHHWITIGIAFLLREN